MKFLGRIKRVPCIDYFAFHRDVRNMGAHKIITTSDYEIEDCYEVYAVVYSKFDDSFCDGADPLQITENGTIEVAADIQISVELLERLEQDGETSVENLAKLEEEL